jgi:hypothetical protein
MEGKIMNNKNNNLVICESSKECKCSCTHKHPHEPIVLIDDNGMCDCISSGCIETTNDKKCIPLLPDNERYKIGKNAFNFTQYSRKNIPKDPPKLKIGDKVLFTIETEIISIGKDCDGTVLYEADMIGDGWGEESFKKI